ncbi:uncharacterized protein A1O5_07659 [Cladophialophora psammophila CBS 110553]|uniref:Dicer-like protein 2 n=1 Tax=Cladophialophora psammophila CBS 110553 TaxID=1182543 RepID=W9WNZ3_9EURO|nr:uncharacterized protein A1O5_07659 [Cladophialophora psammophila CBS 110553]EXJ69623.1 hypothetical protein A1O5_07659 [Cladophialophora psammophila CBS 110553]
MGTGSGKTLIAKLRIEAELERSPDKLVWFTAPSVVLAYQQYRFLSQQLPAFQFRLITGMDSAEYWTTKAVWDKVLDNIQVVISTPAILAQALNYGFISLAGISLLVFDEAHHGIKKASLNEIMKLHYHPHNVPGSNIELPHILGLSASPITNKAGTEVKVLEGNLNAVCKTPLQQLDEYTAFLNMPELTNLTYKTALQSSSQIYRCLAGIVSVIQIHDDPIMKTLRELDSPAAHEKLDKILRKNCTPAMKELQALDRSCKDIQENLGNWACDMFIKKCVEKAEIKQLHTLELNTELSSYQFIKSCLQPLHEQILSNMLSMSAVNSVSPKVQVLLDFLQKEHRSNLRCLVFVQSRNAAWSLNQVLNNHPLTKDCYKSFSFVGVRNPSHQGMFDFAELRIQHDNLERFRRGELNLCVATSVLEEGIDVPAMNLVICFDERQNFRSFVQSRGRARQKGSKFVLIEEVDSKLEKWQALEDEMKQECEDSLRTLEGREYIESMDESEGEIFRVESTGATLTYRGARQLLDRFCAKLPKTDECERPNPIFCIQGEIGVDVVAKVYLPTTLPPSLQKAESKFSRRTEKLAKQDAAFQAYLALYRAGLVTEHLLPPEYPKETNNEPDIEKRDSEYDVQSQYDPWPTLVAQWTTAGTRYAHRLHVEAADFPYPTMQLLLPRKLSGISFPLFTAPSGQMQVSVSTGEEVHHFPTDLGRDVSFLALDVILGRRLPGLNKEQLPFLLVPDMDLPSMRDWYHKASSNTPMVSFLESRPICDNAYLVRFQNHNIPYVWQPGVWQEDASHHECQLKRTQSITEIVGTSLSRKLEYLTSNILPATRSDASRILPVDGCSVLGLPAEYGRLMLLIPSITHMLEIALRTTEACKGPLLSLGFDSVDLVSEALTLPNVGSRNYQRLEFLGDDLLKFYSSLQVFVDYPNHPESQLSVYRDRIVSNARLQRATRTLGLDQYLTRNRFSGPQWSAGVSNSRIRAKNLLQKRLSSKILADVIEALIGAASLSDVGLEDSDAKVLSALKLFLSEIPWRPLSENIVKIQPQDTPSNHRLEAPVESLIGYSFVSKALLAQALTQSNLGGNASSSYDRLEFLGDAVLDHIVKPKLFYTSLQLDPDQMTCRRHALVSHAALAFFALQVSHTRTIFDVQTNHLTKQTVTQEKTETVYLPDYIRRIGNREAPLQRRATLAAYQEVRSSVIESFEIGKKFPWRELSRLAAPKCYSDVVESILGAVFVDSQGDLTACEAVLEKMGYMKLVHRFATELDIDARHPEALLHEAVPNCGLVAQERKKAATGEASRSWRCKVMVEGKRIAHVKGASCKEEAYCRAAEKALEVVGRKRKRESLEQRPDRKGEYGQEQEEEEGLD